MATKNIIGSPSMAKLTMALIKPAWFQKALANTATKKVNSPNKKENTNLICWGSLVGVVVRVIQTTKGIKAKCAWLRTEGAWVIEQKIRE